MKYVKTFEDFLNESTSKKYKKGDTVEYRMDIPASGMVATSKVEKSKYTKTDRITKVTKKFGQNVYILNSGIAISDHEIIGLSESVIKEESESGDYMFFLNLKNIKKNVDSILEIDQTKIEGILQEHDWAENHVAVANENLDQVSDFLSNTNESSAAVTGHDVNENKSDINIAKKKFDEHFKMLKKYLIDTEKIADRLYKNSTDNGLEHIGLANLADSVHARWSEISDANREAMSYEQKFKQ